MPGLAATPVDKSNVKQGLSCPHCELILRDPVQTEDGLRLCRSCFDEISKMPGYHCDKCDSTVTPSEFYPDRAVQRELDTLVVFCKYKNLGCEWQGVLKEWEGHSEGCKFKGVSCPFPGCLQMLLTSELERHKWECSFRPSQCEYCRLQLQFRELEKHHDVCSKYPMVCSRDGCGEKVLREELSGHIQHNCRVEDCKICKQQVLRHTGVELNGDDADRIHLSVPLDNFKHHQSLAGTQRQLKNDIIALKSTTSKNTDTISKTQSNVIQLEQLSKEAKEALSSKIAELQTQLDSLRKRTSRGAEPQSVDNNLATRIKHLEVQDANNQLIIKNQKKEITELKAELQAFRREYHQQLQRTSHMHGIQRHTSVSGRDNQGNSDREASESRVLQLEKRVEEVARQANSAQIQVHEVELQLQASLASTYNGGFLWRIPDISRRRRDAVEERVMSLYSPPFYTARNGYKMCIRAYLNGDGMGYKTHLSLFFVLMKGEFDALLKWPFDHKISMILVDQEHRKHIVQTFKPTVDSNSFQRPRTDMNVASGCPQFAKLSILDEDNYVREDVLFIKCIVDTSKIFHP